MLLKQAGILAIRLPGKIKGVADQGNGADQEIHTDIGEHSREDDGGGAGLPGVMHDEERDGAGDCVTNAGKQSQDGIQPNRMFVPGTMNCSSMILAKNRTC